MRQYRSGSSRFRNVLVTANIAAAVLGGLIGTSRGSEFDRIDGAFLFDLARQADAHGQEAYSLSRLEAMPSVLRGESGTLVVIMTDQGNATKMLVSLGMRKVNPSEKQGPLVPVLILERYETIDAGDRRSVKARGKELMLFDGFQFDLDTGQVVPPGMGGDITFSGVGPDGPMLARVGKYPLYAVDKPLPVSASTPGRPSAGRVILPSDYAGRYQLIANGQWSGALELNVDAAGAVSGQFRSDLNGSVYGVTGQVAMDGPKKILFDVQFPQARQSYEGLLWTEGKNAFAGTLSMLERPYSFVAIRDGTSLAPEGVDFAATRPSSGISGRTLILTLDAGTDRFTLDGKPHPINELTDILSTALKSRPASAALLRVPESAQFDRVLRVVKNIEGAGIRSIRLAPMNDKSGSE
jgi:hypothetical protein